MDGESKINELTIKFLTGDISSEESAILEDLIKTDIENLRSFNELKETWILSSLHNGNSDNSQVRKSFNNLQKKLPEFEKPFQKKVNLQTGFIQKLNHDKFDSIPLEQQIMSVRYQEKVCHEPLQALQ